MLHLMTRGKRWASGPLVPHHAVQGCRENFLASRFEACPPDVRGRLGTAGEVSLTCLLAGNMGCLMEILLAKWILLKSIFWFIPSSVKAS